MATTRYYVDIENLETFWSKAKEYIQTNFVVNGQNFGSDNTILLNGSNIEVGGEGDYKSSTLQAAINDIDGRLDALGSKDTELSTLISNLRTDLTTETTNRTNADTTHTNAISEIKDYTVNTKKISTNPVLTGDDINLGSELDATDYPATQSITDSIDKLREGISEINAYKVNDKLVSSSPTLTGDDNNLATALHSDYPADQSITESINKLRQTITGATIGGGMQLIGPPMTTLPGTTDGYSDGNVIIVGTKEYLCYNGGWIELGDVDAVSQSVSEILASYVKSIKGEGNGVTVTPTESTNGDVTIVVDASNISNSVQEIKSSYVKDITTTDGTYVKLTPDAAAKDNVTIAVIDSAITEALAEKVSKAGDTMTGELGFTGSTYPQIYGNGDALSIGNTSGVSAVVVDQTSLRRGSAGTGVSTTLGTSTYPWSKAYITETIGNLTGVASNAAKAYIYNSAVYSSFPLIFASWNTMGYGALFTGTSNNVIFNPSTGAVTATTFNGDLIGNADTATTAHQLTGLTKRANANATWGTLTAANGYTPIYWIDTPNGGGIGISDKGLKTHFQINGTFYQNEGLYAVLDTSTGAAKSHTHDWADIDNVVVGSNEFNFVPSGFNSEIWLNYRGKNFTSVTVNAYRFGNGAGGLAPCYATNFITSSDRRLKTNMTEIVDASKSLELDFYEFDYKSGGHSAGHIAQEVREVLPKFVHGNETETEHLSVDYAGLHSVQIKALKDKVETLETENKELRERLEKLEKIVEKLV